MAGTLLGALTGYFAALQAVQGVRWVEAVANSLGWSLPTSVQSSTLSIIEACERDKGNILAEIAAAKANAEGDDLLILGVAERYVGECYSETLLFRPGVPTEGAPQLGQGKWVAGWNAASSTLARSTGKGPIGRWLKNALAWLGVATAAGAGCIVLYRLWERTDKTYGMSRALELLLQISANEEAEVAACRGDEACIAQKRQTYTGIRQLLLDSVKPDATPGLLDCPIGMMIGGLVGVGFGWSGMKRLKRM